MKRIGMITVARWMAESLPDDMVAYMEHAGKLFRLDRIRCYNGALRPLFDTPGAGVTGFPWSDVQYKQSYTAESSVYLTMGGNLVGVPLADVIDSVEEMQDRCWALQEGDGFVTRAEPAEASQTIGAQEAGGGEMWYG